MKGEYAVTTCNDDLSCQLDGDLWVGMGNWTELKRKVEVHMSRTFRRRLPGKSLVARLFIVLAAAVVVTACSQGPKGESVIIIGAVSQDGTVSMKGRMSFALNPLSGRLEPSYWKPDTLYLFRVSTDKVGGVSAKAGEIYRVGQNKDLTNVGTFDQATTDDDLVSRYVKK
jgi:hypothetical protein